MIVRRTVLSLPQPSPIKIVTGGKLWGAKLATLRAAGDGGRRQRRRALNVQRVCSKLFLERRLRPRARRCRRRGCHGLHWRRAHDSKSDQGAAAEPYLRYALLPSHGAWMTIITLARARLARVRLGVGGAPGRSSSRPHAERPPLRGETRAAADPAAAQRPRGSGVGA